MVQLIMPDSAKRLHKDYFERTIKPVLEERKDKAYGQEKRDFWNTCTGAWECLAVGKPLQLREKAKELQTKYQKILGSDNLFGREVQIAFGYEKFRNLRSGSWWTYAFTEALGIKVCPYCNQNYILTIHIQDNNGGIVKSRPAIDHFYAKSIYPYLSMSLYNLVPSCETCNSRLKKAIDVGLDTKSPYEYDLDQEFRFRLDGLNDETNKSIGIKIEEHPTDQASLRKYKGIFQWEKVYENHAEMASGIYERKRKYNDNYLEQLFYLAGIGNLSESSNPQESNNSQESSNPSEIRRLTEKEKKEILWGRIPSRQDIFKEPLSKLKKDLIAEVEYYELLGKEKE